MTESRLWVKSQTWSGAEKSVIMQGRLDQFIAIDNVTAAETWLQDTRGKCELLAAQPGIGQIIKTKRFDDARRHVVGNCLIYYRQISAGVEVLMGVRPTANYGGPTRFDLEISAEPASCGQPSAAEQGGRAAGQQFLKSAWRPTPCQAAWR